MPGTVLFGGEQEAAHRVEVFRLVREVDDDGVFVGLLARKHGSLTFPGQQHDVGFVASLVDSSSIDVMHLHLVEMLETRTDVILMMGQHQLMALGKHLMRQVEECLLVRGERSHDVVLMGVIFLDDQKITRISRQSRCPRLIYDS